MSGQSWIRRTSPSSKQGPMKATLPMSSLTRQNSNLRKSQSNSPTLSPTSSWKTTTSPDPTLTGIRSPGALNYRGKCHGGGGGCHSTTSNIRRTASLDTIYLSGQWPRDMNRSLLHVDKATQTDDMESRKCQRYPADTTAMTEDKLDKMIRHRLLQRSSTCKETRPSMQEHGSQTSTPPPVLATYAPANPLPIPVKSRQPMRSSIEGLNQEIERLVLKAMSTLSTEREEEKLVQMTPEGHRAPLADLLRSTRSVNTQTPAYAGSSYSSGASSRESGSPLVAGFMDSSRPSSDLLPAQFASGGDSGESSPDQDNPRSSSQLGTSPRINRFLAREPPDGCERVSLKFTEDASGKDLSLLDYCDMKPSVMFQLKPSLGSAFLPLSSLSQCRPPSPQPATTSSQPATASSDT